MYKISCKIDKNCLRYSLFFHHGPTSPPSLRFSKKPSPGRVKRFLNWNKVFLFFFKKVNTGKGQNSVLCNRFILYSLFSVLTLAFDMAVLYGNDAFSILVLSTKKRYFSSLKKVFVFQKIFFKIRVLKSFKMSTDCHVKTCRSLKRRAILKIPITVFYENLCSFCWL